MLGSKKLRSDKKSWGYNIKSLDDLLMNDWGNADDEMDLELGQSILFEKQPIVEKTPEIINDRLKEPKIEDCSIPIKMEIESDEEEGQPQRDNLCWRPPHGALDELLMDTEELQENDNKDPDLQLGDSILFDEAKFGPPKREREFVPKKPAQQQMSRSCLRRELRLKFAIEAHLSIQEMVDMCEEFSVSYRTVFADFEMMREENQTKCEPGDVCERIRSYYERESEEWPKMRELDPKVRKVLEDDIEAHIKTKKRFTLGYVHLLVEKTNLPPAFVRYQYGAWRGRMMYRQSYSIEHCKRESSNDLTVTAVKILEEAYLEKKYKSMSSEQEFTEEELNWLSKKAKLTVKRIKIWIEKRKEATTGKLGEEAVSVPVMARRCYISPIQKEVMAEVFEENGEEFPKGEALVALEKRVHLKSSTIRTFYNQRKRNIKMEKRFEAAKKEMSTLKPEILKEVTEYSQTVRRNEKENILFAQKVGLSYKSLLGFLEKRKSLGYYRKNPIPLL